MTRERRMTMAAIAASAGVLGGCFGGGAHETGVRIGDATLKQFEAGTTTEAWLLAILGPPTNRAAVEGVENTEVLRYSLTSSRGGIQALLSGNNRHTVATVYFIVTEGIVTRFWSDREVERTPLGQPYEGTEGTKPN